MHLSKALHKVIPLPKFTSSRVSRRANMAEHERAIFYYSNLFSIVITALPIAYMLKANYWASEEQMKLSHVLLHHDAKLDVDSSKQLTF